MVVSFDSSGCWHLFIPIPRNDSLARRDEPAVPFLSRDLCTGSVCPQPTAVHCQGRRIQHIGFTTFGPKPKIYSFRTDILFVFFFFGPLTQVQVCIQWKHLICIWHHIVLLNRTAQWIGIIISLLLSIYLQIVLCTDLLTATMYNMQLTSLCCFWFLRVKWCIFFS